MIIGWVDEALKDWGRQKYKIREKTNGYPTSIFGRIMEYGPGSGDHTRLEQFREGMQGNALQASLAIFRAIHARRLSDRQYEIVFAHYACPEFSRDHKVKALGYRNKAPYYEILGRAHRILEEFFSPDLTE